MNLPKDKVTSTTPCIGITNCRHSINEKEEKDDDDDEAQKKYVLRYRHILLLLLKFNLMKSEYSIYCRIIQKVDKVRRNASIDFSFSFFFVTYNHSGFVCQLNIFGFIWFACFAFRLKLTIS